MMYGLFVLQYVMLAYTLFGFTIPTIKCIVINLFKNHKIIVLIQYNTQEDASTHYMLFILSNAISLVSQYAVWYSHQYTMDTVAI